MTPFDYVFLGLLLLFAVGGLMRGFVREVCALVAVVAAIWAGTRFGREMSPLLLGVVDDPSWRPWVGALLLGFIVWIVVLVIGRLVSNALSKTAFSPVDRFFGFLFGAGRALLMLAFTTLAGTALNLFQGDWWEKAATRPLAEHSALFVGRFIDVKAMIGEQMRGVMGGDIMGAEGKSLMDSASEARSALDQIKGLDAKVNGTPSEGAPPGPPQEP